MANTNSIKCHLWKYLFLKLSDIVSDKDSIFVSNNNSQFFSIDLLSGAINWKQDLSSELRPAIIGNYLVTISDNGLLVVMSKETGQIIRINDLFKNIREKRKKISTYRFFSWQVLCLCFNKQWKNLDCKF